eukprot:TRINITY_DN46972_c0_g1_i1.p1 TRINITY_DN46972_c0_g1~~TRINITY_DN46972_c0_g1_i1.p1  ORF type:complete len:277 (-),score=29.00 TRINITY_DN46972_c0_g1_i1:464-1294(-)
MATFLHRSSPTRSGASTHWMPTQEDWTELAQTVQDILKRLEVLEGVFVFVDFEQINKTISECSKGASEKVGTDTVFPTGQWEAMSVLCEKIRSKSPTHSGGSSSRAHSCDGQGVQEASVGAVDIIGSNTGPEPPTAPAEAVDDLVQETPWEGLSSASELCQTRPPRRLPPLVDSDVPDDLKLRDWDGLSNATDDHERKSTCSTWDLCSSRSGWNVEPEVDPNVFNRFMSQALRPKWESRLSESSMRPTAVQSIAEHPSGPDATGATTPGRSSSEGA